MFASSLFTDSMPTGGYARKVSGVIVALYNRGRRRSCG
jgi:hypothetical protein